MTDAAPKPRASRAKAADPAVIDTSKTATPADVAEIDHKANLPKSPDDIRLGETRMDYCTGFAGIVMARIDFLTGNVQYGIQPRGEGDKVIDCVTIDYHLLSKVDDGIADMLPKIDDTVVVRLGEEVQDIVSGVTGIAIEKTTFQNGCVYFAVQPKSDKKTPNVLPEAVRYPHGRLKVVGRGLLPKPPKAEAPKVDKVKKSPPGGPNGRLNATRSA